MTTNPKFFHAENSSPGTAEELSTPERTMLAFALDLAQQKVWSEDGFTEEETQALERMIRTLTVTSPAAPAQPEFVPLASYLVEEAEEGEFVDDTVCTCAHPSNRYAASISEGHIVLTHKECGMAPYFAYSDWSDLVEMDDFEVSLEWTDEGLHNPFVEGTGCDCNQYIQLMLIGKGEGSGNDQ